MVLHFGFLTQTVLITHQCLNCCWEGLHGVEISVFVTLQSSLPIPLRGLGVPRKLGGDTNGTAYPSWPKGFSLAMVSCSQLGERRKGGHAELQCLSSQLTAKLNNEGLFPWEWLYTLTMGRGKWIPYFALPLCAPFALPIKLIKELSSSQPKCFLILALPPLFPSN